jgi:hypothetical protein
MALVAGQRKPTIRIKIIAMGITDNRASVPTDIFQVIYKLTIMISLAQIHLLTIPEDWVGISKKATFE